MGQAPPKRKSAAARKPKRPAEHGNEGGQSATRRKHFAEIVRPDLLWRWVMERNPTLRHFQQALQDWGKRRNNPSRRPVCLTCQHEFRANGSMPSAWLFARISVNKVGVPKHLLLVGICETCAAKDDATLLREGFADIRKAFPQMPEFKMQVIQEGSGVVN